MRRFLLKQFDPNSLGFVRKVAERRSGKAKTGEERPGSRPTLLVANEHSEPVFNAA
jgi:hypothetical protein